MLANGFNLEAIDKHAIEQFNNGTPEIEAKQATTKQENESSNTKHRNQYCLHYRSEQSPNKHLTKDASHPKKQIVLNAPATVLMSLNSNENREVSRKNTLRQ